MKKITIFAVLLICLTAIPAQAHSGRTDGSGGHHVRATGEYHYHHGYPAHQHENGVCPYKFDDKADRGSGSGGAKDNVKTYNDLKENTPKVIQTKKEMNWWQKILAAAGIAWFIAGPVLGTVLLIPYAIIAAVAVKVFPWLKGQSVGKAVEFIFEPLLFYISPIVAFVVLLFVL